MPEPAGGLTSGEQLGPTREKLERQAWTPAGPANAVRLALRLPTHGEPDARAFHHMPKTARRLPTTWTDEGGTRTPSADARRDHECCAAGAAGPDSRRAACGRISLTARGGRGFEVCEWLRRMLNGPGGMRSRGRETGDPVDGPARKKRPYRWYGDFSSLWFGRAILSTRQLPDGASRVRYPDAPQAGWPTEAAS
jgi:hypothetical protein